MDSVNPSVAWAAARYRSPASAAEVPEEIKRKPWGRLGVDTDGDFTPYYVVPADKKKNVTALRAAMKEASELILATDPDREGESISWHLRELLKPKVKVRRIVFHEITEEAIMKALDEAHDVDENMVRAQESRRILDRLYGYTLSPVLWKKVQTGLSAGRVQSVAVRLVVERECLRFGERASHREPRLVAAPQHPTPVGLGVHERHERRVHVAGCVGGAREVEVRPLAHVVHEELLVGMPHVRHDDCQSREVDEYVLEEFGVLYA